MKSSRDFQNLHAESNFSISVPTNFKDTTGTRGTGTQGKVNGSQSHDFDWPKFCMVGLIPTGVSFFYRCENFAMLLNISKLSSNIIAKFSCSFFIVTQRADGLANAILKEAKAQGVTLEDSTYN